MMRNKWVQAGLTLGMGVGLFVGGLFSLIHSTAPFACGMMIGFLSMWIGGNARGTDGWGGPWNGP